jgi:uncharacterized membrane protein YfcA
VPEPAFLAAVLSHLSDPRLVTVAAVAMLAGVVRGFSGFGAALVYVPLVGAAYDPPTATTSVLMLSVIFSAPFAIHAFPRCDWRSVFPLAFAASAAVPLGAAALQLIDAVIMRWIMSGIVLFSLMILVYGRRYHGRPRLPVTLGVGALAGIFGGAAQMSGPPVVVYWLGGAHPAAVIRANLMVFFTLTAAASVVTYAVQGLFVPRAFAVGLVAGPAYAFGMFIGARLFRLASDATFRRIAILVVALAALLGLPIFDRLYR